MDIVVVLRDKTGECDEAIEDVGKEEVFREFADNIGEVMELFGFKVSTIVAGYPSDSTHESMTITLTE